MWAGCKKLLGASVVGGSCLIIGVLQLEVHRYQSWRHTKVVSVRNKISVEHSVVQNHLNYHSEKKYSLSEYARVTQPRATPDPASQDTVQ